MKRQRGRGRKPGHHHQQSNRTLESNGPDVKVRGSATIIYEKYLQLARDAHSSGDRIQAENYQQHAEHYFRLMRATQPVAPPQQQQPDRFAHDFDYEEETAEGGETEAGAAAPAFEASDQPAEIRGEGEGEQTFESEPQGPGFRGNRRRGRRNRFRPDGDPYRNDNYERREHREGENRELREGREDFEGGRRERFDRNHRDRNGRRGGERKEDAPSEGFAGQTPAFLTSD